MSSPKTKTNRQEQAIAGMLAFALFNTKGELTSAVPPEVRSQAFLKNLSANVGKISDDQVQVGYGAPREIKAGTPILVMLMGASFDQPADHQPEALERAVAEVQKKHPNAHVCVICTQSKAKNEVAKLPRYDTPADAFLALAKKTAA